MFGVATNEKVFTFFVSEMAISSISLILHITLITIPVSPTDARVMYVISARYFGYQVLYTLVFLHREHLAATKDAHIVMVLFPEIHRKARFCTGRCMQLAALFKQIHHYGTLTLSTLPFSCSYKSCILSGSLPYGAINACLRVLVTLSGYCKMFTAETSLGIVHCCDIMHCILQ